MGIKEAPGPFELLQQVAQPHLIFDTQNPAMLSPSRLYSVAFTALFFATMIAAVPVAQESSGAGLGDLVEELLGGIGL
ncbi:hypothetical protein GSI_06073 [Ganoderma sinense ZZ0214-1]|uniref:Uncharacterized protein n=1 Tax=Ganoderma sinense ZZ0214-1 TaxID=1077348 RepID=A0A2G8SCA0_9APHY|nr:hypothetical protein GSI_06073 [Ganoderma sinense ZZ0214-1]